MYGTQTFTDRFGHPKLFENDVKMYGTQTVRCRLILLGQFENDVKMYGTQTQKGFRIRACSLRMM